jgi:putative holliday junction resolvase
VKLFTEIKRVLALDVGDRRIGVAVSDLTWLLARGVRLIYRHKTAEQDFAEIAKLVQEYQVGEIVIGYPRHVSGEVGEQARKVEVFAAALAESLKPDGPSLTLWDERYSSVTAQETLQERGRQLRHLDAIAAAAILQSYLDAQRGPVSLPDPGEAKS